MTQTTPGTRATAFAALALAMLFWAGNPIVGRAIHAQAPPLALATLRWTLALALLTPFAARRVWTDRAAILGHLGPLTLLGLSGVTIFNSLIYIGLGSATATNAMLLQAAVPAFVAILNVALFGLRARPLELVAVAISALGAVVVVTAGNPLALLDRKPGSGDLVLLGAAACWAVYTALLRTRPALHPLSFLWATFFIGTLPLLALLPTGLLDLDRVAWGADVAASVAYLAVFPSIIAFLLFNHAVAGLGPLTAGQGVMLAPIFGALLASLLLGERLHPFHATGMLLTLVGLGSAVLLKARAGRDQRSR